MKKILSITLVLIMVFAFAGCKAKNTDKKDANKSAPELVVTVNKKNVAVVKQETKWEGKTFSYESPAVTEAFGKDKFVKAAVGDTLSVQFRDKYPTLVTFKTILISLDDENLYSENISELVVADFISGKAEFSIKDAFSDYMSKAAEKDKNLSKKTLIRGFVLDCTFENNNTCTYAFVLEM